MSYPTTTKAKTKAPIPTFDLSTVPERDRGRVTAMIPDPRLAEQYIHRRVFGIYDFDLLDMAVHRRRNVMLFGPTGSAKTTFFRAYAAERRMPIAIIECNAAMDPNTVAGRTMPDEHGDIRFIDGDPTLVVRYGGVLLIDEINMLHARLTASYHQLLAVTRKLSVPEAGETIAGGMGGLGDPQPLLLGAALNAGPGVRYEGAGRPNQALNNRFAEPIWWNYDRDIENQLVDSPTLVDQAWMMRGLGEIRTPVSTNMLQEFQEHFNDWGIEAAVGFFVNHFQPEEWGPVQRAFEANSAAIVKELSS